MTQFDKFAAPSPAAPAQDSGLFLRGFISSAVLLAAINASEPLFFGEGHFATLTYHPFWLVILLAAVQHGVFVGLSVVGLATIMMDWPSRPVGMDITEHYVDIATVPAQWLIAALLIGLYRQQQIRHERSLARDNDRLREVNRTLAEEIQRLDVFVARAELAAATRPPQTAEPDKRLAALDRLADADAAHRVPAFIAAARACIPEPVAWLTVDDAGRLVPVAVTDETIELPEIWPSDTPLSKAGGILSTPSDNGADRAPRAIPYRFIPSGHGPGDLLVAMPLHRDPEQISPSLNVLGRALENSLRHIQDGPSEPPPFSAAVPAHA